MLVSRFFALYLICWLIAGSGSVWSSAVYRQEALAIDSGWVSNTSTSPGLKVVFEKEIEVPRAISLRLFFSSETSLSGDDAHATIVRLTSLQDGAQQHLKRSTLKQWGWSSSYFNGSRMRIELLAHPGTAPSRLRLSSAFAEERPTTPAVCHSCGEAEVALSADKRVGRLVGLASQETCTAWLFDAEQLALTTTRNKGLLAVGHCPAQERVLQFNVPLASSDGIPTHPKPEDQYMVDTESVQSNGAPDFAYFGVFRNTETGKTPFETQGAFFSLLEKGEKVRLGEAIRITGFGGRTTTQPAEWNHVLKTAQGELLSYSTNTIYTTTPVTIGNSGSPIVNESTGKAIGILSARSCSATATISLGPSILHPAIQNALLNPRGVLTPGPRNCYVDCNGDQVLDEEDLACFTKQWLAKNPRANCNGNVTSEGTLIFDEADFDCFRRKLTWGCG